VTVTAPTVDDLTLSVPDKIEVDESVSATVEAELSNGETNTVTDTAEIRTESDAVSVDGSTITGDATGSATVTASYRGQEATAEVTVTGLAVESLTLSVPDEIELGETASVTVQAELSNGETDTVTDAADIEVASGDISVTDSTITGESAGPAAVRASYSGREATAALSVVPATVTDLSLSVQNTIEVGQSASATVAATFSNNTTRTVTDAATLTSSDPAVSVTGSTVTGAEAGSATVTASYRDQQDTAGVTVSAATVEDLSLSIPGEIDVGERQPVTVEATFSNGTTQPVTEAATFTTPGAVSVEGSEIVGVAGAKQATVTANYRGAQATDTLTVVGLDRIEFSISPGTIDVGDAASATVTAFYTDRTEDVTDEATLTPQDPSLVSFEGTDIRGETGGETTIGATFGGESASADLSVVGISGLSLSLADDELFVGESTQATAEATFTNGTTVDVTDRTTVSSASPDVSISGAQVTGNSDGQATLSTTFRGQQANATLEVVDIVSLDLSLARSEIGAGERTPATAEATFTNGTTTEVTAGTTLSSNATGIAIIEGTDVAGLRGGTAEIAATFRGEQSTALVTVVELEDISITLEENPIDVFDTTSATVTAQFSDGSTEDVTGDATIAAADGGDLVSIAGAQITGDGSGEATIEATLRDKRTIVNLVVIGIANIDVTLGDAVIDDSSGSGTPITVTASFTNGTTGVDITDRAATELFSANTTVAEVLTSGGGSIIALANTPGTTSIEARFLDGSGGAGLTVVSAD